MNKTNIEYLDYTWNPIAMRCTPVSEGCKNCWHLRMANRLSKNKMIHEFEREAYSGGKPVFLKDRLTSHLRIKKPSRIGAQFMGDIFHSSISSENIAAVFIRIAWSHAHKFLILTKRPERMKEFIFGYKFPSGKSMAETILPNVWLGVTVENDKERDRIETLRSIPAAVRFVSFEPLLSSIGNIRLQGIHWAIVGCESGQGRRPCKLEWVENLVTQCGDAGLFIFVKQAEINGKLVKMPEIMGQIWNEYPA